MHDGECSPAPLSLTRRGTWKNFEVCYDFITHFKVLLTIVVDIANVNGTTGEHCEHTGKLAASSMSTSDTCTHLLLSSQALPSWLTPHPFAPSPFRSPVLPLAVLSLTLAATPLSLPIASRTCPKAIFRIRVSRVSIGTLFGAYVSFPSMLTWFCPPGRLGVFGFEFLG